MPKTPLNSLTQKEQKLVETNIPNFGDVSDEAKSAFGGMFLALAQDISLARARDPEIRKSAEKLEQLWKEQEKERAHERRVARQFRKLPAGTVL
ncbi:hypothetical protein [Ruegeria sp. SCP11]|uniref:hypothetical protein n=1 Tax=Ruegeria sp. SCP11 TaxID=3141378 RepID=UPI00333A0EBE